MTVPAVEPRKQYVADGGTGPVVIPFPFSFDNDLDVYDGEDLKVLTTQYTLTGAGNPNGGTLTWVSGQQPANLSVVTIVRNQATVRTTDLNSGSLRYSVFNDEYDYIIQGLQDLAFRAGLSIKVSPIEGSGLTIPDAATRANKHLAFDGSGAVSLTTDAPASTLSYADPPITLIDGQSAYPLPAEVQSGLDEDNYAARITNGGILERGDDFTVTGDVLTLTTTPTAANGLAGETLEVELVRPAIDGTAVQSRTITGNAIVLNGVKGENLGITGQDYGDILWRSPTDWVLLEPPAVDGKYYLRMTVSGGGTVFTPSWQPGGLLNNWQFTTNNSVVPLTAILPDDDNKMTITQGQEILTRTFTLSDNVAGVRIFVTVNAAVRDNATFRVGIFRAGDTNALRESKREEYSPAGTNEMRLITFSHEYLTTSPGSVTYSVRIAVTSDVSAYLNADANGSRTGGGNIVSTMFIEELGSTV